MGGRFDLTTMPQFMPNLQHLFCICFFSNAYILFTTHPFTVSPMKAFFLWFQVLLWINASRHVVV